MVDFIRLTTAHADELAIASGLVVSCRRPRPDGAIPVVAGRSAGTLVVTANSNEDVAFTLAGKTLHCPILVLGVVATAGGWALTDPATRTYLTGVPMLDGAATCPVVFGSAGIDAWERFVAAGIDGLAINAGAAARITAALGVFDAELSADRLARLIASPGAHTASVLDASLASLPTSVLDEVAARIIDDAALRASLARAYPADLWAQVALPALAEWVRGQAPPPAAEVPAAKPGFLARILGRRTSASHPPHARQEPNQSSEVPAQPSQPSPAQPA